MVANATITAAGAFGAVASSDHIPASKAGDRGYHSVNALAGYMASAIAATLPSYRTKAAAVADVANIAANAFIQVWVDETVLNHNTVYQKVSGSLVFVRDKDVGTIITPEVFGAVGDGVTDDTVALYGAYAAIGSGKTTIVLKPGATYLTGGPIQLRDGWVVQGYGAKIKRINEVSSATATAISSGTTAVTVANGALFKVGWHITVYNGSSYETVPHRIASIAGNVLTVTGTWQVAFASGGTVITCGYTIAGAGCVDAKVLGVEIDDNKSNNTTLNRWQTHAAIEVYGQGTIVEGCYVHDCCSEGIVGGDGGHVNKNRIANCNGNGVHLTGTNAMSYVTENDIRNTNIILATLHNEGAICLSNTAGAFISFNYLDTGLCGVGAIDSVYDGHVHIKVNEILNMTANAIEGVLPNGQTLDALFIEGNTIKDCVTLEVNFTGTVGNGGFTNVRMNDNTLINTKVLLRGITGLRISNLSIDLTGDTTHVGFDHGTLTDAVIDGLSVIGGLNGAFHNGSNVDVIFNAPKFKNNYQRGMNGIGGTVNNLQVLLESTYVTASTWWGATTANGEIIQGGLLRGVADPAATAIGILLPNGGVSVRGGTVTGVIVLITGLDYDIRANGGSQNNTVKACGCVGTVSNAGSGTWDTYVMVA